MFHLAIDDLRNVPDVDMICRTASDGKKALQNQTVTHLYLDNDLGEKVEGIDILKWAQDNDLVPEYVIILTSNTIAKNRMIDLLEFDLDYKRVGEITWRRT